MFSSIYTAIDKAKIMVCSSGKIQKYLANGVNMRIIDQFVIVV